MNEKLVEKNVASTSENGELLKVLIDKTVDNGTAIKDTQELIRKLNPEVAVAGLDRRMEELEGRVAGSITALDGRVTQMEGKINVIREGVAAVNVQLGEPSGWLMNSMRDLRLSLEGYVEMFSKPMKKEVHHRHFLGWPIFVLFGLLVVVGVEWMALTSARTRAELHEQNDVLWRAARLSDDPAVTGALDGVVRQYDANPAQFEKDLVAEEERRVELFEQRQREDAAKGKIQELEKEKKVLRK